MCPGITAFHVLPREGLKDANGDLENIQGIYVEQIIFTASADGNSKSEDLTESVSEWAFQSKP